MGRLPRQRSPDQRRGRPDRLVVAISAEHLPDARQDICQLRQLAVDQDGSDRRGLQRRHRARHVRLSERGQRPEPVRRPRRLHLHAAADRVDPAGDHPQQRDHHRARTRLQGPRRDAPARAAVHLRRGVLCRHRGRDHADPLGRQGPDRRRRTRSDHGGDPAGVLRHHQGRSARSPQLADVCLPGRAAAAGRRRISQRPAARS